MNIPKTGERYRHFKGKSYEIVAIATHSETNEELVIYRALYGDFSVYARPLEMFMSKVDREKYPDVIQEYRFEKLIPEDEEALRNEEAGEIDSRLLAFLNTDTYGQKVEVLESMRDSVTDSLIDTFAAASDLEIKHGAVADRFEELLNCLRTYARFECDRLR